MRGGGSACEVARGPSGEGGVTKGHGGTGGVARGVGDPSEGTTTRVRAWARRTVQS